MDWEIIVILGLLFYLFLAWLFLRFGGDLQVTVKTHNLFVYGTLRPGRSAQYLVPGELYELGWFPGIKLLAPDAGKFVLAERLIVTDDQLKYYDDYEGYRPDDEEGSLFRRIPYLDGYLYIYNGDFEGKKLINEGNEPADWLAFRKAKLLGHNQPPVSLYDETVADDGIKEEAV